MFGIVTLVIGSTIARGIEKLGRFGVVFMPAVGLGVGFAIRAASGSNGVWFQAFAALLAYAVAMSTHIPSEYEMFRHEFGAPVVRSALLSFTVSLKYPIEVSRQFPFYGVMLILSIIAASLGASSN
jgi:hypothetical protein